MFLSEHFPICEDLAIRNHHFFGILELLTLFSNLPKDYLSHMYGGHFNAALNLNLLVL